MSEACYFKDSLGQSHLYNPKELKSFSLLNGPTYISLAFDSNLVFAEQVTDCSINLFSVKNKDGYTFFVENDSLGLKQLPFDTEIKFVEDNRSTNKTTYQDKVLNEHIISDSHYKIRTTYHKRILSDYINNSAFHGEIENIKIPSKSNLSKLLYHYHVQDCNEASCYHPYGRKDRLAVKPVTLSGLVVSSFPDNEKVMYSPNLTFNFRFSLPAVGKNLFINTGAEFGLYPLARNPENLTLMRVPVEFGYQLQTRVFQPYVSKAIFSPTYNLGVDIRLGELMFVSTVGSLGFVKSTLLATIPSTKSLRYFSYRLGVGFDFG